MNDTELAALRVLVERHPGPYIATGDPVYWLQVFTGKPVNTLTITTMAETLPALLARLAAAEAVCKAFAVWEATPNPEHGSPKAYTDLICAAGVWQTLVGWSGRDTMALTHDAAREVRT
jgi:hypothetical protein